MILTRKMIDQMRLYSRIDETLEQMLLDQFGSEPCPHAYSEQDIYEQSRKMIMRYTESEITGLESYQTMNTRSNQEALNEEIP
jgi:hypothetical protein